MEPPQTPDRPGWRDAAALALLALSLTQMAGAVDLADLSPAGC